MNNYTYLLLLITFIISAGCSHLTKEKTLSPQPKPDKPEPLVVWADDSSEVAFAVLSSEPNHSQDKLNNETKIATLKHQIWVQNSDGSERRALTEWRDSQPGQIFYMKQAGYLVVESLLEGGARRFDKIELSGNEILIIETPDKAHQPCQQQADDSAPRVYHTVIPSPDGQQLAHIYSPECGKVTVEFLYANNLNIFDNQTMNIDEPMKATWHRDGYIILATDNNDKAWRVSPLAPPLPILPPHCLSPVTTSSAISLEGKKVYLEGETVRTEAVKPERVFGCQ